MTENDFNDIVVSSGNEEQIKNFLRQNYDPMKPIRIERNRLLSMCDWTQATDAPLTEEKRQEWAVYRQKLRDLPSQFDSPEIVEWPLKP